MDDANTRSGFWLILLVLALVAGAFYLVYSYYSDEESVKGDEVACTMEAKLCPDGSYVGRTGPECEFAACPSASDMVWNSTSTPLATFRYPTALSKSYLSTVDWPPMISVLDDDFSCVEAGKETDTAGMTSEETINGKEYCVTKESEGAAGSVYTQYAYAFSKDNKTIIVTFSLRKPQCGNYPEPQSSACNEEQESFDLDGLVDQMASSVELKAN